MKRIVALFLLIPSLAFADTLDTRFIQATPTVDTAIYAPGETVGTLMTFTAACNVRTDRGEVLGVKIFDKDKEAADLDLVLFRSTPAGTFTDNAAFDPTDAGLLAITANISVTDEAAFSDNGMSFKTEIVRPIRCTDGVAYGYLVSRGTPTYTSASDLTVQIEVVAD